MKDPLQQEATAYEILQIQEDATEADVDAAFGAARRQGSDIRQLTRAWQALKRPADRAFLDLLRYDGDSLHTLSPSPLDDPSVLDVSARAATAAAWEKQLRARYPDYRSAHSLAVLWYWWALRESGRAAHAAQADHAENSPDPVTLWKVAAAYWAMLAASEDFWAARPRVSHELATQIAQKMERTLRERFDSLAMRHRDDGQAAEAERYGSLELCFTTELWTAQALAGSVLRLGGRPACSGPVLLERLGLRNKVARQLDYALTRAPGDAELRRARDALSSYGQISAHVEEGQARQALELIAALPRQTRGTEEVRSLKGRALIALGNQEAELGRVDDAIDQWAQVLQLKIDEAQETARHAIVSTTREQAATLSGKDDQRAIALLEKGHRLTGDPALRSILAELLARRGIDTINRAGNRTAHGTGATGAVKQELKSGTKDLERAAELGSATATGQLETARALMRQISVGDVVDAANGAAQRQDWDTAVAKLRTAMQTLGDQAPQELQQNLAVALANRANQNAEQAMKVAAAAREAALSDIKGPLSTVKAEYRRQRRHSRHVLWGWLLLAGAPVWWWASTNTAHLTKGAILDRTGIVVGTLIFLYFLAYVLISFVQWLKEASSITTFGPGYAPPRCAVCRVVAVYQVHSTSLCAPHAEALEGAEQSARVFTWLSNPGMGQQTIQMLDSAAADLREAFVLAPGLDGVTESFRQLGELRERLGLTVFGRSHG